MQLEFREYQARKIVNTHRHVDGPWFWGKYTAHPYVGCRSGCEFCYSRGGRYLGKRDPETFDTLIQVKINAVDLLRKELSRLAPEVISCGDWQQPAEDRFGYPAECSKSCWISAFRSLSSNARRFSSRPGSACGDQPASVGWDPVQLQQC